MTNPIKTSCFAHVTLLPFEGEPIEFITDGNLDLQPGFPLHHRRGEDLDLYVVSKTTVVWNSDDPVPIAGRVYNGMRLVPRGALTQFIEARQYKVPEEDVRHTPELGSANTTPEEP